MTEQSLFPDLGPTIAEQIRETDLEINLLLCGRAVPGGLTLSDDEKRVLRFVRYRRGAANAISIAEMRKAMGIEVQIPGVRTLSDREIKQAVRTLRINFHLPIGSSKSGLGGYFIMISPEDRAILYNQILDQVRAELEVLRATNRPHEALKMLDQLQLEMQMAQEAA